MNADVFIDTNVLLDTIDEDTGSASKRQRAQQLLLSEQWDWSVQVAAEFFVNATSAKRPFRLTTADAPRWWRPGSLFRPSRLLRTSFALPWTSNSGFNWHTGTPPSSQRQSAWIAVSSTAKT
jgi:hypothetical protein